MNNNHELLVDSLLKKIYDEFPNNNIITKKSLTDIFINVNLNDKNKIKILYKKIIEKLRVYNSSDNNSSNNLSNNLSNNCNTSLKVSDTLNKSFENLPKPVEISNQINKDIDIAPKKMDDNLETKKIILNINSKYRDQEKYPNPFNFSINFNIDNANENEVRFNLNNIQSFEIKNIIVKDSDKLGDFIFLEIDEINSELVSNNKILKDAYCLLYDYKKINNFRYYSVNRKTNFDVSKAFNKLSFCLKNSKGEKIVDDENNIEIIIEIFKLSINFFNNFTEYQIKDKI